MGAAARQGAAAACARTRYCPGGCRSPPPRNAPAARALFFGVLAAVMSVDGVVVVEREGAFMASVGGAEHLEDGMYSCVRTESAAVPSAPQ
jgi:hypothetical protein